MRETYMVAVSAMTLDAVVMRKIWIMDASQDGLPAVEKQGKAARGVLAF
jgi:hypothetical protein